MGLPMEYFDDDESSIPDVNDQRDSQTGAIQDYLDGRTEGQLDAAALFELENRNLEPLEDYFQMISSPPASRHALVWESAEELRRDDLRLAASNGVPEIVQRSVNLPVNATFSTTPDRSNRQLPPDPPAPDELWPETIARIGRWFLHEAPRRSAQPSAAGGEISPALYLASLTTNTEPPSRRATRPTETLYDRSRFTYPDVNPSSIPIATLNEPSRGPYPPTMPVPTPRARHAQSIVSERAERLPTTGVLAPYFAERYAAPDFDEAEARATADAALMPEYVRDFERMTGARNRLVRRHEVTQEDIFPGSHEDDLDDEVIR